MGHELRETEQYLHDALGVSAAATPWGGDRGLPHFLRESYGFAETILLGSRVLLVIDRNDTEQSPATIRKHLDLLRDRQAAEPVYVRERVTSYNRKRLVEHRIPFIVPGKQLYLPMLAIDFREHFLKLRETPVTVSPATQAVIIDRLLGNGDAPIAPLETARRLHYTPMTLTRVFDELEAAELGEATKNGRERHLRLTTPRRELWERAKPLLRTPVARRLFVRSTGSPPSRIESGLAALSRQSMLAAPPHPVYALSQPEWKAVKAGADIQRVPEDDPAVEEIEVWTYPPGLFARDGVADPFSLYLSLRDARDERVEAALEEMMEAMKW